MPKVTLIGAGSAVFARQVITDILAVDGLDRGVFALVDIDPDRLDLARRIAERLVEITEKSWTVEASTERLDVLKGKTVVLGIVDARNTRLETTGELGKLVDEALKLVPSESLWIAPTTGLEYLPHDVARKKLTALAEAARGGVPA